MPSESGLSALADNRALKKARHWTVGFGWLAVTLGVLALLLGLFGGDGETSGSGWVIQGLVMLIIGGIQIYFGKQLTANEVSARRGLNVLSWLMIVSLVLGALSLLTGDFSVVLPMLFAVAFLMLYRDGKRSLNASNTMQTPSPSAT